MQLSEAAQWDRWPQSVDASEGASTPGATLHSIPAAA